MKTIIYRSVLMIVALFGTSNLVFAQWIQKTNMPTPRSCLSVETVNGKIYAIGGSEGVQPLNSVEEYDPMTDTWVRKRRMPTHRGYFSSSVVNGEIYSIGGYNPSTLTTVEKYNPIADTWTEKSSLKTRRWGNGTCTVDGKIYVIGGAYGWPATAKSTVEEYDHIADSWAYKTSMPTKRWMLSCSVVNGKIYAIGGCDISNKGTSVVEEYDPATDTWTTKSPMPTGRLGLTAGVVNGKIYVIGGVDKYPQSTCYNIVEVYDPITDTWIIGDPLPVERGGLSSQSVVLDGWLYVIGGCGFESIHVYSEVYALDLTTKVEENIIKHNDYSLYQNYPNPFNPSTTINYSVPEQSYVTLRVIDMLGREVVILVNKHQRPGNYEVNFNAVNLASGTYFYRLIAGDYSKTMKMILIK